MATEAAPPRTLTQAERRARSEQALLDAAARLIAERGVEQASLARIGELAGTSRGLATHHFGSKDALVARLARRSQDRVAAATVDAMERAHQDPDVVVGLDLLRATLATYLELFEHPTADERALIVMWGATFPAQASIDGMVEAEQRGYDGWADVIRRGQQDGSIRGDADPLATAVALFGFMRGVAALLLTDSSIGDLRHVVRATCDAWVVGALAPPGSDGTAPRS
jgi:AcrR family transcriptional regulator